MPESDMGAEETLFAEAVELFSKGMYWDSIEAFDTLLDNNCHDDLVDDISLNIAINFMHLGLYEQAKTHFLKVYECKIGNGVFDADENNIGNTSARAALGLFRIALAKDEFQEAKRLLDELKADKSGVITADGFVTFYKIAKAELSNFTSQL